MNIGLTPCFMYPDVNRPYFSPKTLSYAENDMVRFVTDQKAMPHLILELPDDLLEKQVQQLDGIIFTGGSDLCPESYDEDYLDKEKWPGDIYRDKYELKIFELAKKYKKPVLGICRGFQVINTAFGGTLYQDIPSQFDTEVEHRSAEKYDKIYHDVEFIENGFLAHIYKDDMQMKINTVHHQCVKELGKGLKIEAISPRDKIIEAFSSETMNDHFVLGVQWHPEFSPTLEGTVIDHRPLIQYFLKNCELQRSLHAGN